LVGFAGVSRKIAATRPSRFACFTAACIAALPRSTSKPTLFTPNSGRIDWISVSVPP
jgi:hypothetical protein